MRGFAGHGCWHGTDPGSSPLLPWLRAPLWKPSHPPPLAWWSLPGSLALHCWRPAPVAFGDCGGLLRPLVGGHCAGRLILPPRSVPKLSALLLSAPWPGTFTAGQAGLIAITHAGMLGAHPRKSSARIQPHPRPVLGGVDFPGLAAPPAQKAERRRGNDFPHRLSPVIRSADAIAGGPRPAEICRCVMFALWRGQARPGLSPNDGAASCAGGWHAMGSWRSLPGRCWWWRPRSPIRDDTVLEAGADWPGRPMP